MRAISVVLKPAAISFKISIWTADIELSGPLRTHGNALFASGLTIANEIWIAIFAVEFISSLFKKIAPSGKLGIFELINLGSL